MTSNPKPLPQVGDTLPPYRRVANLQAWNRFAAVNDEFIDMHMDVTAAKQLGYPDVIGMGNLQTAYLHCLIRSWSATHHARLARLYCQFRGFSLPGMTLTAFGRVTRRTRDSSGSMIVTVELSIQDDDGHVITSGEADLQFD